MEAFFSALSLESKWQKKPGWGLQKISAWYQYSELNDLQVLFGLHPIAAHVCSCISCNHMHWGIMLRAHVEIFRIAIKKLFKWLFSRMLAFHMSVSGPLVYDENDLSLVSSKGKNLLHFIWIFSSKYYLSASVLTSFLERSQTKCQVRSLLLKRVIFAKKSFRREINCTDYVSDLHSIKYNALRITLYPKFAPLQYSQAFYKVSCKVYTV